MSDFVAELLQIQEPPSGPSLERLLGGGGCIFIYSGYARLTSFEINFISKETSRAEPEYMNIHRPPINVLATALATVRFEQMGAWNLLLGL